MTKNLYQDVKGFSSALQSFQIVSPNISQVHFKVQKLQVTRGKNLSILFREVILIKIAYWETNTEVELPSSYLVDGFSKSTQLVRIEVQCWNDSAGHLCMDKASKVYLTILIGRLSYKWHLFLNKFPNRFNNMLSWHRLCLLIKMRQPRWAIATILVFLNPSASISIIEHILLNHQEGRNQARDP